MRFLRRPTDCATCTAERPPDEFDVVKEEARRRTEEQEQRLDVLEMYAKQAVDVRRPYRRRKTDRQENPSS